jgi:WD40 repeat protein
LSGSFKQLELWDLASASKVCLVWRQQTFARPVNGGLAWDSQSYWVNEPSQIVWSRDSRKFAVVFREGVVIYRVPEGKPVRWLGRTAQCVGFGTDDRDVYYGADKNHINIGTVEAAPGELPVRDDHRIDGCPDLTMIAPRATWSGPGGTVLALAVSPDGRTLACSADDGMIQLRELPSGRSLAQWQAHERSVTSLAWMPGSQTLIAGASDGMLKVWDLRAIRRELGALGLDWNDDVKPALDDDAR